MAKTTYFTKCGEIIEKSTNAGTTGNRLDDYGPEHECYGCPHVIPLYTGYPQKLTGHECRCSPDGVRYDSYYSGSANDKNTMHIYSLDVDFLAEVAKMAGELPGFDGDHKLSELRPADYPGEDGMRSLTLRPAQNKKGMQAKQKIIDEFFNPDGSRKNILQGREKSLVLRQIDWYKAQARVAAGVALVEEPTADAEEPTAATPAEPDTGALQLLQAETIDAFDTSGIDEETLAYLNEKKSELQKATAEYATTAGRILCDAQARLADHNQGTFERWYTSMGLKKRTVYNLIQRYQLIRSAKIAQPGVLEQLPLTLAYAISAPGAPEELVQQVVDGDITSHAEYKRLQAELEKVKKEAEDLQFHYDNVHATLGKAHEESQQRMREAEEYKVQLFSLRQELDAAQQQASRYIDESGVATAEILQLKQQLQELEARPVDVAVEAVSEEQLDELAQKARQEAAAAYEADRAALVAEIEQREELFKKTAEKAAIHEARTKELEEQLREAQRQAPTADFETAWKMARDFAHTISTYEKLFVGASHGLDQGNYKMCADVLLKALDSMRLEVRGALSAYDAMPVEGGIFDD